MFSKRDFFNSILDNKNDEADTIIKLLKARGCLIESKDNEYFLSDNSHKDDAIFLNDVVNQYDIGEYKDNKIFIYNSKECLRLLDLFLEGSTQIGYEACIINKNWQRYKTDFFAEKVPVRCLEPFIAMYVKALSACGLSTALSCDGNHTNYNKVTVKFSGYLYELWHKWIINKVINMSDLKWSENYTKITFNKMDQYYVYCRLLCSANHLYKNRNALRCLRRESCLWMNKRTTRGLSEDEIFDVIAQKANTLLTKELMFYDV